MLLAEITLQTIHESPSCSFPIPEAISHLPCLRIENLIDNGKVDNLELVGYGMEGMGLKLTPVEGGSTPLLLKLFTKIGIDPDKLEKVVNNVQLSPQLVSLNNWRIDAGNIHGYVDEIIGTGPELEETIRRNNEKQVVLRQALAYEIAGEMDWTQHGFDYVPVPKVHALIVGVQGRPIGFIADFIEGSSHDQKDFLGEFQKVRQALLPRRVIPDSFGKGNIILPANRKPMFIDLKYLGDLPS